MSSGFQANDAGDRPFADAAPAAKNEDQQLLDQVLEATLVLSPDDTPLTDEELRKLRLVARQRGGEELTVDTVMELVQAVLRLRYRRLAASAEVWEKLTRQIAESLFNDPRAQEKLRSLWTSLCEAAS